MSIRKSLIRTYFDGKPWLIESERAEREAHAITGFVFRQLLCPSCGCHPIGFMVRDDVWLSAGLPTGARKAGYWCLECFETKLGRAVEIDDLTDVPLNDWLALRLIAQRLRRS